MSVWLVERAIAAQDFEEARTALRGFLYEKPPCLGLKGSIADAISLLANDSAPHPERSAYLLRCLAVPNLLPSSIAANAVPRNLVTLCERSLPQVCDFIGLPQKRQTHEKIALLQTAHDRASSILAPLRAAPFTVPEFAAVKQATLRALNHSLIESYCRPLNVKQLTTGVQGLFLTLHRLHSTESDIANALSTCEEHIAQQESFCQSHFSFLTNEFYRPFLDKASLAVKTYVQQARSRFFTSMTCRLGTNETLLKRYPLHEEGREVALLIPLRSAGPGVALSATAQMETDSDEVLFEDESISLGNIKPGEFSTTCHIIVVSACEGFSFTFTLSWDEVGDIDRKEAVFMINVAPQRSDVDWESLTYRRPYSTEVAKGPAFVGRSKKVLTLANNLLRTPMDSFYITGQKRVGKTSLALAALDFAKRHDQGAAITGLHLLWGEIAHEEPRDSLKQLGRRISGLIQSSLPPEQRYGPSDFEGTLATIIPLAERALALDRERKYVIIIDEFDEIHPELYMHGNLAETFFANTRAINTCDNVCIMLIGGENMPFIMERQGQKLNKFVRVLLDYFSRDTEWEDFKLLVRRLTEGAIDWHDEAITEIFSITNGNPYFTKIICAKVYAEAVEERDADITANEIRRAVAAELGTFDINSFVHLWQDGIHKAVDCREPDIVRRCRVLVASARTVRKGQPLTCANIISNRHSGALAETEVQPVLDDFTRRDVLREGDGEYHFALPIFGMWLAEVGISRLSSNLSEELARSVQAAEDAAYVHSDEIAALARKWPTYRGRSIGTDEIRAWCEQVEGHRSQRLLFKLLQNVKLYGEAQIREKLRTAHQSFVRPVIPEFVVRKRSERRTDVLITYVDGQGKSGQFYAARYAEENRISSKAIVSPTDLQAAYSESRTKGSPISAIVVVDDIIATGQSFATNLVRAMSNNWPRGILVPVILIALTATAEGEERVRNELAKIEDVPIDLRVCDVLGIESFAFGPNKIWSDADERGKAKALCIDLGARIYRDNPLGYGEQALLVVFPETCPNNSLPILHSPSRPNSDQSWVPLFPRVTN